MSKLIIDRNDTIGETITIQRSKLDECIKYINDNSVESVYIWDWKYDSGDLTFLKECKPVKRININNRFVKDVKDLGQVDQLEVLMLDTFARIDVGNLKNLKSLSADYSKIEGLDSLENLNELYLWNYIEENQFEDISHLHDLTSLYLIEPKTTSLEGIGKLKKLESLEIAYAKKLMDITAIADLKNTLLELRIDNSKKVNDFSDIGELCLLKKLALCDDGEMESISFIKRMPNLKSFIFVKTNVLDGEMSYCDKLEHAMFTNKRHYSHKRNAFKQYK